MDIQLVILVVGAMAVAIGYWALREDKQNKEISELTKRIYKSVDRDGDGKIFDGTPLERKAPKKKAVAKKKPAKKVVAKKKATPAKKKPVKKSVKKKAAAPKKKKAVAKKKSR
jgi:outer membrane biosynthesis protein TonB